MRLSEPFLPEELLSDRYNDVFVFMLCFFMHLNGLLKLFSCSFMYQIVADQSRVSSVPSKSPGASFLNSRLLVFTGRRVNKHRRDVPDHRWGGVCN